MRSNPANNFYLSSTHLHPTIRALKAQFRLSTKHRHLDNPYIKLYNTYEIHNQFPPKHLHQLNKNSRRTQKSCQELYLTLLKSQTHQVKYLPRFTRLNSIRFYLLHGVAFRTVYRVFKRSLSTLKSIILDECCQKKFAVVTKYAHQLQLFKFKSENLKGHEQILNLIDLRRNRSCNEVQILSFCINIQDISLYSKQILEKIQSSYASISNTNEIEICMHEELPRLTELIFEIHIQNKQMVEIMNNSLDFPESLKKMEIIIFGETEKFQDFPLDLKYIHRLKNLQELSLIVMVRTDQVEWAKSVALLLKALPNPDKLIFLSHLITRNETVVDFEPINSILQRFINLKLFRWDSWINLDLNSLGSHLKQLNVLRLRENQCLKNFSFKNLTDLDLYIHWDQAKTLLHYIKALLHLKTLAIWIVNDISDSLQMTLAQTDDFFSLISSSLPSSLRELELDFKQYVDFESLSICTRKWLSNRELIIVLIRFGQHEKIEREVNKAFIEERYSFEQNDDNDENDDYEENDDNEGK